MNILAINTAFSESYVALSVDNKELYKVIDSSLKQSENILGLIDETLEDANIKLKDIDVLSLVVGPGSFTGIRIGVGLFKGFCVANYGFKKIEINSLDLIAYSYSKLTENDFTVVLNGLGGYFFVCKYSGDGARLDEPKLLTELSGLSGDIVGLYCEKLSFCNSFVKLNSKDLLEYSKLLAQKDCYSKTFTPFYLRKSQAEDDLDKKNKNN